MPTAEAGPEWSGVEQMPIGRQLHDIVVPQLFMLTTGLTALRRRSDAAAGDPLIRDLVDTAAQALNDLRAISRGQGTGDGGSLRDVGDRLRGATSTVSHLTNCALTFDIEGDAEIRPALADDLVAVVWEALANAIRHGGAERVHVVLWAPVGSVVLVVEDDGAWCEPAAADSRGGTGLEGLERRAIRWGGAVTVTPSAEGTRLEWRVPHVGDDQRVVAW